MKRIKRAFYITLGVALAILIIISVTGGNIFENDNIVLSLVASFVLFGLPSLFFKVKEKEKEVASKASSSSSHHSSTHSSKGTDYWDPRNIPSHWEKARACIDGDHDGTTASKGNATRCFKCGKPFDGEWGDRGVLDGYFCVRHRQFIARGSYCYKCAQEGLIEP